MDYEIVIVGGGAGGLELASRLGRKLGRRQGRDKVLLIDRSVFHLWKPSLHEVAAGTLDPRQEGLSYSILARRNHFSFLLGELVALDAAAKSIDLGPVLDDAGAELVAPRRIGFGTLVLATGCGSNFFATPGAGYAHVLEQTRDAERFQRRLLAAFTRAAFSAH
jgi:NADH dehydrogenase